MTETAAQDPDVRQQWETPQALFDGLHQEFKFDIDVAANADNAKVLQFYSATINGLKQPWDGRRIWCNPPYRDIGPWVEKAADSAMAHGTTAVLLLPSRTEQPWFRIALHRSVELAFFDARINFVPPRGVAATSNREGHVLVVFGPSKFGRIETIRCSRTGRVLSTWNRTL